MAARSSDEEKCRYFESILLKREIGRKNAGLFLKWAELEEKVHGKEQAISVLRKGIAFGAEPLDTLQNRLSQWLNVSIDTNKHDGEDAATVKIPTIELKKGGVAMAKSKRKRVSFGEEVSVSKVKKTSNCTPETSEGPNKENVHINTHHALPGTCNSNAAVLPSPSCGENAFGKAERITLHGEGYFVLQLLGKGGSSAVHRVVSCKDGAVYALKRIEVRGDSEDSDEVLAGYANEISLLQRLKGSAHIIELVDHHIDRENRQLTLLLEAGDIDLAKLLSQRLKDGSSSVDPLLARMIWKDMLLAVQHIHMSRIVHGNDLPTLPALFLGQHRNSPTPISQCALCRRPKARELRAGAWASQAD